MFDSTKELTRSYKSKKDKQCNTLQMTLLCSDVLFNRKLTYACPEDRQLIFFEAEKNVKIYDLAFLVGTRSLYNEFCELGVDGIFENYELILM